MSGSANLVPISGKADGPPARDAGAEAVASLNAKTVRKYIVA